MANPMICKSLQISFFLLPFFYSCQTNDRMVAADHNGALQTTALNRKLKILAYFEAVYIVAYFEADINGLPFCFFDFKVDEMNAKR